jgi:threonine synthase
VCVLPPSVLLLVVAPFILSNLVCDPLSPSSKNIKSKTIKFQKEGEIKTEFGTASHGKLSVSDDLLQQMHADGFLSESATSEEALEVIRETFKNHNYLLCPHTACGVVAASKLNKLSDNNNDNITVCLATAHPAKFYESVCKAVGGDLPPLPVELEQLKV